MTNLQRRADKPVSAFAFSVRACEDKTDLQSRTGQDCYPTASNLISQRSIPAQVERTDDRVQEYR